MLNAPGALTAAQRPVAAVSIGTPSGSVVHLDGMASFAACSRTLQNFEWTVVNASTAPSPILSQPNLSNVDVQLPTSGILTIRLQVTDNLGAVDSFEVVLTPTGSVTNSTPIASGDACPTAITITQDPPTSTTPPAPSTTSSDSGGGFIEIYLLALLSGLRVVQLRRKHRL
jgi:hypothetical protein